MKKHLQSSNIIKLVAFCVILLMIRVIMTQHFSFLFLLWNLFLAWLPYWFISKYKKYTKTSDRVMVLGLTILFLPNAPYILTDLFHLSKNLLAPMWFDLIMILSFSMLGLILFMMTTDKLFEILKPFTKSHVQFKCLKIVTMLLTGYGMYLGRFLRFNSWDVITSPNILIKRIFTSLFYAEQFKETIAITLTFAVFLYLILEIYESFKSKIKATSDELHEGP